MVKIQLQMDKKKGYLFIRCDMKIKDLVGYLTYEEIKERKWKIPRLWKNGKWLVFLDYILSNDGIILRTAPWKGGNSHPGDRIRVNTFGKYSATKLTLKKKRIGFSMHRLMWETWEGKIPEGKEINHKDGNKENYFNLDNLETLTPKENVRHAMKIGLHWTKKHRKAMGKIRKGMKFSEETRKRMRKAWEIRKLRKVKYDYA